LVAAFNVTGARSPRSIRATLGFTMHGTGRLFGDLDVRLDPWDVDYGSEVPLEADEPPSEDVVLDVEVPPGEWMPLTPPPIAPPRLVFVDGVRRIEARLVVRRGDRVAHGAFGSFAVGSVRAGDGGAAVCGEVRLERVVATGSGEVIPAPIVVDPVLTYRPVSTADPSADGPLRRIQEEMRVAEERLGSDLARAERALVVVDGPLTFEEPGHGSAVGYIKRLFRLYLPPPQLTLLGHLRPGARTPLFALRSTKRFARYSWFLRLAHPQAADSDLAGLVRLEVSESVGREEARRRADATAATLPAFAPPRSRDPRAPQNLLPIGALEAQLRRRLGDARLARRRIESLIVQEVPRE
jgi:hypothetical protein